MVKQVYFQQTGGADVLQLREVLISQPTAEEVLVHHTAIGVNFIDTMVRSGKISFPAASGLLGMEACGVVEACGSNVTQFEIGQRVAYATCPLPGAYAEKRCVDQKYLMAVPDGIADEIIAAGYLKSLTAFMLARRVFIVRSNNIVLVHAAAGGVGGLLCQLCKSMGAYVIGTVGSEDKRAIAQQNGCDIVFNYQTEDWVAEALKATNNLGVNAVYDSIGQATYKGSISCLIKMGILIMYGSASGAVNEIKLTDLAAKSLFLTRPSLFDYQPNRMELVLASHDIFTLMQNNLLTPIIHERYPLAMISQAHIALENRQTKGAIILTT